MRLRIEIDANCEEPETLITTARMTDEVNRIRRFYKPGKCCNNNHFWYQK